jgi:hypothetical protein
MAEEEEYRVGMKEGRSMTFCQTKVIGPNKKVDMAETIGDSMTREGEECQAVFAMGGIVQAVSPQILEQAVWATMMDKRFRSGTCTQIFGCHFGWGDSWGGLWRRRKSLGKYFRDGFGFGCQLGNQCRWTKGHCGRGHIGFQQRSRHGQQNM